MEHKIFETFEIYSKFTTQPTVGYSNLISSLMAQGVMSLANQAPVQVTKSILSSIFISHFPSIFV